MNYNYNRVKKNYVKPCMKIHDVWIENIVCTSPNLLFYEGGGGTYGEDTTLDNGDY